MITEHDELTPAARHDMAQASRPATTRPLIPAGKPTTMNCGSIWSAWPTIVPPSAKQVRAGAEVAPQPQARHHQDRADHASAASVVISTVRAALASLVDR